MILAPSASRLCAHGHRHERGRALHRALRGDADYKIVVVKDCCADGDDEADPRAPEKVLRATHVQAQTSSFIVWIRRGLPR